MSRTETPVIEAGGSRMRRPSSLFVAALLALAWYLYSNFRLAGRAVWVRVRL